MSEATALPTEPQPLPMMNLVNLTNLSFCAACMPAKCGRAVADSMFSVDETHKLLSLAKKGLVKGGSNGGASILDLHSGALSKVSLVDNFFSFLTHFEGVRKF